MFDNARDGHSTADPAFGTVGPAWTSPSLNGQIYAEPLVYGGVVYVATENDQLYALNQANGAILKQWNLGGPAGGFRCGNINGITGTPVIDTVNRVLYAVGATNTAPTYKLFKVDLANYSTPVQSFNAQSLTGFDPTIQGQRGALALNNGTVYVPYGGRAGDCGVYHGYVAAFDLNGNPVGAFETTPHSCAGGVWSPGGESVDGSGNVYAGSGNGPTSGLTGCSPTNVYDYQESVLKLNATAGLVANWAPQNWLSLDQGDTDIGSVTPTLLPGGLIFQSGKNGHGYVLDSSALGSGPSSDTGIDIPGAGECMGSSAFDGTNIYVGCDGGLFALRLNAAGKRPTRPPPSSTRPGPGTTSSTMSTTTTRPGGSRTVGPAGGIRRTCAFPTSPATWPGCRSCARAPTCRRSCGRCRWATSTS